MVERVLEASLERLELRDSGVVIAVSGGIDSTALVHGLHALSERWGLKLSLAHVNHALRGEESEADERAVLALARRLALPSASRRCDPAPLREGRASRERPTLQEAARTLRYRALEEMRSEVGADWIATAHTSNDQAETVLLRLMRGCGPDGLAGIPERVAVRRLVRPLLRARRDEIERYASDHGLVWREDRSNESDAYARNRLRRHWLPLLEREFNPQLLRAISQLAEAMQQEAEWLEGLVEIEAGRWLERRGAALAIEADGWDALPGALARRLVRRALRELGGGRDLTRVHVERMLEFLRDGRAGRVLELPGGLRLRREGEHFTLRVEPLAAC